MPKEVIELLHPWQKWLIQQCVSNQYQKVTIVVDEHNYIMGKSDFLKYLEHKKLAYEIPRFTKRKDYKGIPPQKVYIIRMPLKRDISSQMCGRLESLSDGVLYEKRKRFFQKQRIDRPKVFVFTDNMPPKRSLALIKSYRWQLYQISDAMNAVQIDLS